MWILIISGIVLGLGVLLCNGDFQECGLALILISILFGFGVFGFGVPSDSRLEKQESFNIVKTPNRIIIEAGDDLKSFTDMKYSDITKDNIEVYKKIYSNAYGLEVFDSDTDIVIKFKE